MNAQLINQDSFSLEFNVRGMDFAKAGEAASRIKATLQQIGMGPEIIRRAVIAAYESELNIVIHAYSGKIKANISPEIITLVAEDEGPGIPDIPLAMQEGFSTAPPHIRKMGFGAGMGLPNIKKFTDHLTIQSEIGKGTMLEMLLYNK